jgi:hypothetical protein
VQGKRHGPSTQIAARGRRRGGFFTRPGKFCASSNDLTPLTLGVDRDSEISAHEFDERDGAAAAANRSLPQPEPELC